VHQSQPKLSASQSSVAPLEQIPEDALTGPQNCLVFISITTHSSLLLKNQKKEEKTEEGRWGGTEIGVNSP
jgi:hypothetical protein